MLVSVINPCTHIYFKSHSSSNLDPAFIDLYILSEQLANCYPQAYSPSELEYLIGPFHTSPLGLVPKLHSTIFQMIQDLSYPWNEPHL